MTENFNQFHRINFVINLKNRLKKEHFQNLIDENSDNSKKLWKTLNSLIPNDKRSTTTPNFLTEEGVEITDKKQIVETFNKFFSSIGTKLASVFKGFSRYYNALLFA